MVLSESGLNETVYNDFIIGDDCDVTIGLLRHPQLRVQNSSTRDPLLPCARVRWERHYGEGDGMGRTS